MQGSEIEIFCCLNFILLLVFLSSFIECTVGTLVLNVVVYISCKPHAFGAVPLCQVIEMVILPLTFVVYFDGCALWSSLPGKV